MIRGFTLVEVLVVMSILAILAGSAVVAYGEVGSTADAGMIASECTRVRDACRRFAQDVGRPPRYIAELLQDPADPTTAWWWNSGPAVHPYDPVLRRGWHGPYLLAQLCSDEPATAAQPVTATGESDLSSSAGHVLWILGSHYQSHHQDLSPDTAGDDSTRRRRSHYQLVTASGELVVRFVHDPTPDDGSPVQVVCSLPTGLRP